MAIKRKILTYKDFTKGKNTLENPVKHPIKESVKFVSPDAYEANKKNHLPDGFFRVTKTFILTPGGGWRIKFNQGEILKSNMRDRKLFRYTNGEWVNVKPPIQSVENLDLIKYENGPTMVKEFIANTKEISYEERNEMIKNGKLKLQESEDKSFTPREEMIKLLNQKFPNVVAKTERFKKDDVNGIWSAAENTSFIDNAKKISAFNTTGSYSYNPKLDKDYELEVHKTLAKFLKDHGWYTEFYDDATPIFYPIYNTNESVLEKELTQDAKDFIAKKIKFLIGEGRPQKQAVAMAYSYAKKEGYDVPANESEILDEAAGDIKFSWKEQSKSYGKQAIGYDNSLRSWECRIHGEVIARLNNSGYLANSLGGDSLNLWKVTFATKSGPSFTMSKKFEKDQLQQAKDYVESLYKRVLAADETTPDKNLLDFKAKMVFPVKQVKVAGEYKGLKKLLKEKLGKNFDYYFGTEASGRTIRYRPDFEETGNLMYAGSGAPTSELKMIQDALGEDYVVTHNARVISIRKK